MPSGRLAPVLKRDSTKHRYVKDILREFLVTLRSCFCYVKDIFQEVFVKLRTFLGSFFVLLRGYVKDIS